MREGVYVWKITNQHKALLDNSYMIISNEHYNFFWEWKGQRG